MNNEHDIILNSTLGKVTDYSQHHYNPDVLFSIPRHLKRAELGISTQLPFYGFDTWNDYETSWLNSQGKPIVAITECHIPCTSTYIIESKSLKLYLNSLSNTQFSSKEAVADIITQDLSRAAGGDVTIQIHTLDTIKNMTLHSPPGICIDGLDIDIDTYTINTDFLTADTTRRVTETLHTHLLKSNCPVTQQPDWGTLVIEYAGAALSHEGLLRYVISLRHQYEFHEQCIERIFMALLERCQPEKLLVLGRYTRRGGKDINPYRSTDPAICFMNQRVVRQ